MRRFPVAFIGVILADLSVLLVAEGPTWDTPKDTTLFLNSSRSDVCDRVTILEATSGTGRPVLFTVVSQDPHVGFKVVPDYNIGAHVLQCSSEQIEDGTYIVVVRANYTSGSSDFTDLTLNITFAKSKSDKDECAAVPCKNGGNCTSLKDGYNCTCKPGFNGTNCEINLDECAADPCENGGQCTDLIDGYNCTCRPGFNGTNCEINKDECAADPCKNGGQCNDLIDGYNCTCTPGFAGTTCEINIDDCAAGPCKNGGECTDLVDDYRCTCKPGFAGKTCETISPAGQCECHPDNYWDGKNCVAKASICSDSCDTSALVVIVVLLSLLVVALVIFVIYLTMKMKRNSGQLGIVSKETSVITKSQEPKYVNVAYVDEETKPKCQLEGQAQREDVRTPDETGQVKEINRSDATEDKNDDKRPLVQSEIQAKHEDVRTQEESNLDEKSSDSNGSKDEGQNPRNVNGAFGEDGQHPEGQHEDVETHRKGHKHIVLRYIFFTFNMPVRFSTKMDKKSVCRCLFGIPDHDELKKELKAQLAQTGVEMKNTWNFDPILDQPLEGRYEWSMSDNVPSFYTKGYKPTKFRSRRSVVEKNSDITPPTSPVLTVPVISRLTSETDSDVEAEAIAMRRENETTPENRVVKQTRIEDFMKVKKRRLSDEDDESRPSKSSRTT